MGVNSSPKTVTRQRRDCDLNPGLLRLSQARYPLGYRATRTLPGDVISHNYIHHRLMLHRPVFGADDVPALRARLGRVEFEHAGDALTGVRKS